MTKRHVQIQIHPLGCLFWLVILVLFVAGMNWAWSR